VESRTGVAAALEQILEGVPAFCYRPLPGRASGYASLITYCASALVLWYVHSSGPGRSDSERIGCSGAATVSLEEPK
jgi:hypothetical protein